MENNKEEIKTGFEYNTGRRALRLPEYGRNVQKMVAYLKTIEDRDKRNEQARAVVKVMELLNPQVHLQDNYEQKLWDHLQIIADFELDVDSPYPMPQKESLDTKPDLIPLEKRSMKSSHYGKISPDLIKLIGEVEDEGTREWLLHNMAAFMKMQYLSWNKDTVNDETIFADMVRMSGGSISVPEGMQIGRVQSLESQRNNASNRNNIKNRRNKQKNFKK